MILKLFKAYYTFRNILNPNMFSGICADTLVRMMEMADSLQIRWIFEAVKSQIRKNESALLALILVRRVSVLTACVREALIVNVLTKSRSFWVPLENANPPLDDAAILFMLECFDASTYGRQETCKVKCDCVNCKFISEEEHFYNEHLYVNEERGGKKMKLSL